jgi:outer membrane protein TolC
MTIASMSLAVFGQNTVASPNNVHNSLTLVMAIHQPRPDIRAAEEQKESAKNAIGVAQAVAESATPQHVSAARL